MNRICTSQVQPNRTPVLAALNKHRAVTDHPCWSAAEGQGQSLDELYLMQANYYQQTHVQEMNEYNLGKRKGRDAFS